MYELVPTTSGEHLPALVPTGVTHPLPVQIEEITRQPRVHVVFALDQRVLYGPRIAQAIDGNMSLFSGRTRFFQNPERPKRHERPAGSLSSVSNCGAVKFGLPALLRDLNQADENRRPLWFSQKEFASGLL